MATKRITKQIKAKASKPSSWAAISGLAAGLAPLFPQYQAALAAIGLIAGTVGTFMPAKPEEIKP
jgi:hypothetical protein